VASSGVIAETADLGWLPAGVPIAGIAGDQQAALFGQACFAPGEAKCTYGTGAFLLMNVGEAPVASKAGLLSTVAWKLGDRVSYALEGSSFIAGAAVQWLRDGLGFFSSSAEVEGLAASVPNAAGVSFVPALAAKSDAGQDVYLVPAFVGLGAPYWQPEARGALFGLTRATGPGELARAALEAVCYQTRDLIQAMHSDWTVGARPVLRVDGGMVASDWTMQFLADILDAPVERPTIGETTALGAAWLAGHKAGVWPDAAGFAKLWKLQRGFEPQMDSSTREKKIGAWRDAVIRTLTKSR